MCFRQKLDPGAVQGTSAAWDGRTLRGRLPILPPGGRWVVTFSASVREDAAAGKLVVNSAQVLATGGLSARSDAYLALPPAELPKVGGGSGRAPAAVSGMHPQRAATTRTRPLWPVPLAGLAALVLYAWTLAPGLTWAHHAADGGDLLAAALVGGVPHPSGYPTYQLLLRTAIALFPGEPARAGNWLSALCAAAAAALCADLAGRMLARIDPRGAAPGWSGLAALAAALTWAASPILWGQAVVTEVYALNALTVVGLLWLLWRWREAVDAGTLGRKWPEGWPWLAGAGAVLGLGLGNHLTLLLMLPGAAIWLWAGRRAGGPAAGPRITGRAGRGGCWSDRLRLSAAGGRNQSAGELGDPRRPAQLWALISGQVYRGLIFGLPLAYLPARLAAWSGETLRQFGGPWGVILALIGLWQLDRRLHAWWQATLLIAAAYSVYAIGYNTPDSFVYLIPASCVAALWLAAGSGLAG